MLYNWEKTKITYLGISLYTIQMPMLMNNMTMGNLFLILLLLKQ